MADNASNDFILMSWKIPRGLRTHLMLPSSRHIPIKYINYSKNKGLSSQLLSRCILRTFALLQLWQGQHNSDTLVQLAHGPFAPNYLFCFCGETGDRAGAGDSSQQFSR